MRLDVETLLLSIILVFAVLLPPIRPPVRMEDPLLAALLVWIGFKSLRFPAHRLSVGFSLALALAATSSMLVAVIIGAPIEVPRMVAVYLLILKYVILVWCAAHVLYDWPRLRFAMIATLCAGLLSSLVAVGQYLNIGPINSVLTPIYASQENTVFLLQDEHILRRAFGTSFNPNHFGFLMVVVAAVSLLLYSTSHKRMYLVAHLFILVAILLTLSRTTLISYLLVVVTYHWFQSKSKVMFTTILVLLAGLAMVVLAAVTDSDIALLARILEFDLGTEGEGSWPTRVQIWATALTQVQRGPLSMVFGLGPGVTLDTDIDSQYVYLIYAHGVLGFTLVVGLQIWVLIRALANVDDKSKLAALGVLLLIPPLFLMQVTAKLITDVQYSTLLLVFVASLYRIMQMRLDYQVPTTRRPA